MSLARVRKLPADGRSHNEQGTASVEEKRRLNMLKETTALQSSLEEKYNELLTLTSEDPQTVDVTRKKRFGIFPIEPRKKEAEIQHEDTVKVEEYSKREDYIVDLIYTSVWKTSSDVSAQNEKYQSRSIVTDTVRCICTLADRIGGAAGIGFPAAPACFNAVTFFLQFWVNHTENYLRVEELLTKCNSILGRFHRYAIHPSEETDDALQLIVYEAFVHVIDILCYAIKMRKGSKRELFRQSFLGDSRISNLTTQLQDLVERENSLLTTLTFQQVQSINQILRFQSKDRNAEASRKLIASTLGFEEEEPQHIWVTQLRRIKSLEGTAGWLWGNGMFTDWHKWIAGSRPILVLEGASKTGKTHIMASIVRHLQRKEGCVVAFYFHDSSGRGAGEPEHVLASLLRCLLWQCVTTAKLINRTTDVCAELGSNANLHAAWKRLFLDYPANEASTEPVYIIIDGFDVFDRSFEAKLNTSIQSWVGHKHRKVRVLVSASVFSTSQSGEHPRSCIPLRQGEILNNSSDVTTYINSKLNSMYVFQTFDRPRTAEVRKKVTESIKDKTEGDYAWMEMVLRQLHNLHRLVDIDAVLETLQDSKQTQARGEIQSVSEKLSKADANELNDVILWSLTESRNLNVSEMETILSLGGHQESLLPLQDRLKPLFIVTESNQIQCRLPEITKELRETQISAEKPSESHTAISRSLQQRDLDQVHRFLTYVVPRREYNKEELERILWQESAKANKTPLGYDALNAHIRISLNCLKVLMSDKSQGLHEYAGEYLVHHLGNIDLENANHGMKSELGKWLVKSFQDARYVDSLFWTTSKPMSHRSWRLTEGKRLEQNRQRWLCTDEGAEKMDRLLRNSVVFEGIEESLRNLVEEFLKEQEAGKGYAVLLRKSAKQLARRLFLENTYTRRAQLTAVYFLIEFIDKSVISQKLQAGTQMDKLNESFPFEKIQTIVEWAYRELEPGPEEAWLWKLQAARLYLSVCDNDDEPAHAAANSLMAEVQKVNRSLWEDSLLAYHTIAVEMKFKQDLPGAREVLLRATERILNKATGDKILNCVDPILVADIFLELALIKRERLLSEAGKPKRTARFLPEAASLILQSLDHDRTRYSKYLEVLRIYHDTSQWAHSLEFLKKLSERVEPHKGAFEKSYLDRLVYEFLATKEFPKYVLATETKDPKNWNDMIDNLSTEAIKAAEGSPAELFHTKRVFGQILDACGNGRRKADALRLWQEAVDLVRPSKLAEDCVVGTRIYSVVDPLARSYLDGALLELGADYSRKLLKLQANVDQWLDIPLLCCQAHYLSVQDKKSGIPIVKDTIGLCISVLTDGDLSNDWFAFAQLGKIFNAVMDNENAEEAWGRLKGLDEAEAVLLPTFICDHCGTNISLKSGLWVCLYCFGPCYVHTACLQRQQKHYYRKSVSSRPSIHAGVSIPPAQATGPPTGNTRPSLEKWLTAVGKKYLNQKASTVLPNLDGDRPATQRPPVVKVYSGSRRSPTPDRETAVHRRKKRHSRRGSLGSDSEKKTRRRGSIFSSDSDEGKPQKTASPALETEERTVWER